ncbi:RNA-directed DNA polymerase, eukaryota, reverse transcriptase zinc-binding domain protein [Tanacetum coccineum]|uniref:RNA-directed DNA polymerase, eukaryota, reverse transcriptase zinc-binding domain protein n=1 Tax=Tanacetum coccineum TaxID=301880 RepID=A0ABQ5H2I1_9ASTR
MLCVFILLAWAAKRWVDRLPPGTVDSRDLLKNAFNQRYCPSSRTTKQLEEIRNFKQEGDETLYQAWECLGAMNRQLLDSQGLIPGMTPVQALTKLKENVHAIQVGCQNCEGAHLDKDCPLKEEVKSIEEAKYGKFGRPSPFSNGAKYHLGTNVNVIPKYIFKHLKLARLKKTDMLIEMADMTKRSPIGIVENIHVKIDKFLFPSEFMVMDMLNTRNETMIFGRPFLATIHAEIDIFTKEISLGIGGDRVTFDMDKMIHKFTTPIGEIHMINTTYNTPSDASSRVEETNDVHTYQEQGRSHKKPRKLEFNINLPSTHFCKPVKQILEGELKFWPTCDPNIKECNGGHEMYEMNKEGDLKKWYCYYDDNRKKINGASLSFLNSSNKYELGIGKKGPMLEDIWENYRKVQEDNTYWWHDHKSEEAERRQLGTDIEEYDPPMVHVETFEVKRYSFDTGQNFICVTKELMDALPLGRENGSRFRDMIRKETDSGRRIHRKT